MVTVENTCDLPGGAYEVIPVKDEQDAEQNAAGKEAYLHTSKIIDGQWLFVKGESGQAAILIALLILLVACLGLYLLYPYMPHGG